MLKLLTMGTTMVETWLTGSCSLELLDAALTYWRFKTEFPCFLSEAFLTPQDWKGRKLPGYKIINQISEIVSKQI